MSTAAVTTRLLAGGKGTEKPVTKAPVVERKAEAIASTVSFPTEKIALTSEALTDDMTCPGIAGDSCIGRGATPRIDHADLAPVSLGIFRNEFLQYTLCRHS